MGMRFRKEACVLGVIPLTVWCSRYSWCRCSAYIGNVDADLDRWELEGWSPQCISEKETSTLRNSHTWSRGSRGSAVLGAAFLSSLVSLCWHLSFLSFYLLLFSNTYTHLQTFILYIRDQQFFLRARSKYFRFYWLHTLLTYFFLKQPLKM